MRFEPGEYLFREGDAGRRVLSDPPRPRRAGDRARPAGARSRSQTVRRRRDRRRRPGSSRPIAGRYDARAVELVRAIGIDAACLRDKCEADHHARL